MVAWFVAAAILSTTAWWFLGPARPDQLAHFENGIAEALESGDTKSVEVARSSYEQHLRLQGQRSVLKVFVPLLLIVGIPVFGVQYNDWFAKRVTSTTAEYSAGWNAGWVDSCSTLFPYRTMFYKGEAFSADWCNTLNEGALDPDFNPDVGGQSDAYGRGTDDAWKRAPQAVFSRVPVLCYGTECVSAEGRSEGSEY